MRRASFFSPKAIASSARGAVTPFYQNQRVTYNFKGMARVVCPQVFYTTRFMSWQWLLAGVAIPSIVWAFHSYTANYQSTPFAIGSSELQFSQEQVLAAATWWAQFLRPNTDFSEIHKNTGIQDGIFETVVHMRLDRNDRITDEQSKKFIEILSAKIQLQKLQTDLDIPSYIQIGHCDSYDTPQIVNESLDEANISGVFPAQTQMMIYSNGHVMVNDECIYTNPSLTHYDSNTSFAESTQMVISGDKFREITIPMSRAQQGLWEGYKGNWHRVDPKNLLRNGSAGEEAPNIYAKVHLGDFKGSEADFLQLTNEDWISIFSTWSELKKHMNEETVCVFYQKQKISPQLKNSFKHIGPVTYRLVDQNRPDYYEVTTGPVRAMSVPKAGTVGKSYLWPVSAGDMIFKRECQPEKGAVYFLPARDTFFSAKPLSKVDNPITEGEKDLSSQERINCVEKQINVSDGAHHMKRIVC